jgi:hypothetical protein
MAFKVDTPQAFAGQIPGTSYEGTPKYEEKAQDLLLFLPRCRDKTFPT